MTVTAVTEVGLSFGSNQGGRISNLTRSKEQLDVIDGIDVVDQSSLYETEPVGVKPEYQHLKFMNAVLVLSITIPVRELHRHCLEVEREIGRVRGDDRYAPRPLDIDILYAGSEVSDEPGLTLPHPQCRKRRFVLEPLAEVRPELVLPTTDVTVIELVGKLSGDEVVEKLPTPW